MYAPPPLWTTAVAYHGYTVRKERNQPIALSSHTYTDKYKILKIATVFCRQFSKNILHTIDKAARAFKLKVVKDYPLDHHTQGFSTSMVMQAIKACGNSIATGPDDLTMLQLSIWGLGASVSSPTSTP